ncbi:hypothetical protein SM124_01520 [Bacillus sp. 31A1R]|uniref:Uncharacterized protein n=1 Tax=Robertmurraya mangrovi TaxID=3098077 RepID=A0ABU5ITG6_9BACI|nr:hypothetical protein [Bacillus sp. 31A1R]MDZ5470416.1 hypothetical protein [Bacillus sp. 31A1R]
MFRLMFVNAFTQEPLRHTDNYSEEQILDVIDGFSVAKGEECFIFDYDLNTLSAEYVTHNKFLEDETTVYKLFFKTELADIQLPLI